jgi:phosphoglycerate dehydrogenase-like enzyme/glyoxylase-like metal-dependent hydrolase (beta-lactamase superfamily II)
MRSPKSAAVAGLVLLFIIGSLTRAADDLPKMKFNEVKEIAPGVFFRYSQISATDKKLEFGGSNNIWIVFEDYVVVIDANFPKGAAEVIAAVKKTTDKPIRYVFDTHHHGDHAYGNAVFAKAGASVIAQTNCARLLRVNGPKEFADAGRAPDGRKDVRESTLKVPDVIFGDKFVLDDGKQRVEFLFFGHAHTAGDACAYLPKHKVLCTGDACVNGAFNFMGHSDSVSWVRALEKMQQLDVKMVAPGHGPMATKDLLEKQKRYFVEMRQAVKAGITAKKTLEDIQKSFKPTWYKEWTEVDPAGDNIKYVYDEMTGRTMPYDLAEDFGIYAGDSPTKDSHGWKEPKRIVVPSGLMPARLEELKLIAPKVEFIPAKNEAEAAKFVGDADAVLGFCTPEIVKSGKGLRWIQSGHASADHDLSRELVDSNIVLTNMARVHGPEAADQAFALLLSLTRGLRRVSADQMTEMEISNTRDRLLRELPEARKPDADNNWRKLDGELMELHGKTMLVVGLGGIGSQVSRRAHAFGMRVRAIDPKDMERPDYVFSLDKPAKLMDLLPGADVVVIACPLTPETKGLFGDKQLAAMKKTAYLINVARGGIVDTAALTAALKNKQIAGAGLDVVDPEPLPNDHPFWKMANVAITPHASGTSPEAADRTWRLERENVRRFVAGEPLLCVVDKKRGY